MDGKFEITVALALLALLAMPGMATAQTQCFPNNPSMPSAGTTCYDNRPPALPPAPSYDQSVILPRAPGECGLLNRACRARAAEVSALIQRGDCQGAVNRALQDNDFALAEKAKSLCAPR